METDKISSAAQPILRPRRLGHVNLFVSDLEKARDFYSRLCGFTEIFEEPGITAAFMSNGNTHHDLGLIEVSRTDRLGRDGKVLIAAAQRGAEAGLNHLGFEMESERQLVEAYQLMAERGVKVARAVDHGLAHSVYMPDPDGNMLEFYADVVDDWRGFWKDSVGKTVTGAWVPALDGADPQPRYPARFEPDVLAGAPIHARRVTCATLATARMQAMLDFYVGVVGLTPRPGATPAAVTLLGATGEAAIHLVAAGAGRQAAFADMGVELDGPEALARAKACLRDRGLPVEADGPAGFLTRDPDGFGVRFHAAH